MTSAETKLSAGVDDNVLDARISSYTIAYFWAAMFNLVLVIFKESFPAVHDGMAALGHHWVTHGVLDLIVFFVIGVILTGSGKQITGSAAVNYLIWGTVVGGGGIFLFMLLA